jgi:hypothetical protein
MKASPTDTVDWDSDNAVEAGMVSPTACIGSANAAESPNAAALMAVLRNVENIVTPLGVGSFVGTAFVRDKHPFGEFTVSQATGGCIRWLCPT